MSIAILGADPDSNPEHFGPVTMNTLDRLSSSSAEGASSADRASYESRRSRTTMSENTSEGRYTRPSSMSSMGATDGDTHITLDEECAETGRSPADDPTESEFLELSDDLPTAERLRQADDVRIYDADGSERPFSSLYRGTEHPGQRQLLIFIRHFYCGSCQAYVQRLCEVITPSAYFSLPTPTTITILGCGEPYLIPRYGTKTHCPFRMYTDPSLRLYKLFGMTRRNIRAGKKPDYHPDHFVPMVAKSIAAMVKAGRRDGTSGGPSMLIGGEILFEEGQPIWCHRMKSMRGHADFKTLARVLEMPEDKDGYPASREGIRLESSSKSQAGVDNATSVSAERPSGLKLVYDTSRSDVPRARLARDSREYS